MSVLPFDYISVGVKIWLKITEIKKKEYFLKEYFINLLFLDNKKNYSNIRLKKKDDETKTLLSSKFKIDFEPSSSSSISE